MMIRNSLLRDSSGDSHITRRDFARNLAAACLTISMLSNLSSATALSHENQGSLELSSANNAFAIELLKRQVKVKPSGNQFLSPFSIETALMITLEGARGQTAEQMLHAMQATKSGKAALLNGYSEVRSSLLLDSPAANTNVRAEVDRLKKELATVNASAQKLAKEGKLAEANKVRLQAVDLANRINQQSQSLAPFELTTANSLWLDQSYPLSPAYEQTVDRIFGTSAANACDFQGNTEAERVRINRWVASHTQDRIQDIIPMGVLSPRTRLVIANAIYFKGNWQQPFDVARTQSASFTCSDQSKTQVDMMFAPSLNQAKYAAFQADNQLFETPLQIEEGQELTQGYPANEGYQVLELPYQGKRLSMLVVLPRSETGLNKLVENFSVKQFDAIRQKLNQRSVHVKLPKFKLETTYDLIPDLQTLGMMDAFSPQLADFSGLTQSRSPDDRLYISLVIHKAFVEVNEQGTEAAAATVVGMSRAAAPARRPFVPEFTANRPFLISIFDNVTNMILFVGKVDALG